LNDVDINVVRIPQDPNTTWNPWASLQWQVS